MLIENLMERPFSSWNARPKVGEPSYGYFARLVAEDGHVSVKVYANEIGLNGRNIVPEEMLTALQRLPLSEDDIAGLARWTPVRSGPHYRIGTETVRLKQLSMIKRRWCPQCLLESAHHRIWWDFVCYEVCPRHNMKLESKTDNGQALRWHWPHFDMGADGTNVGGPTNVSSPGGDAPSLETLIEGRLLGHMDLPMAEFQLHHLIEASDTVGRFLFDGGTAREGFVALGKGNPALVEMLRERILATVPEARRRKGMTAAIGNLVHGSMPADNPLRERLELLAIQAFSAIGRIGRKRLRAVDIERSEFTLVETAAELGVTRKGLSRFAKHLGIGHTPWKDAHSFSKEDIGVLREKLVDLITTPETIPITGVPGHEFRFLERAGFIASHPGLFPGSPAVRYLRKDVEELVGKALALAPNSDAEGITLFSFAKRTKQPQGAVLVKVLRGRLRPCQLVSDAVGLRKLSFAHTQKY